MSLAFETGTTPGGGDPPSGYPAGMSVFNIANDDDSWPAPGVLAHFNGNAFAGDHQVLIANDGVYVRYNGGGTWNGWRCVDETAL